MLSLNSENYDSVLVHLRDKEILELPVSNGVKLMEYLTSELATKHVKLTTKTGQTVVVLITDITKVEPKQKGKSIDELYRRFA